MGVEFQTDTPLYLQIAAHLKREIIAGTFRAGDRLPSIRDMAVSYEVTPNTLQRALQLLEQEGIIRTERTSGKFITSDETLLESLRRDVLRERAGDMARALLQYGYTADDILSAIKDALKGDDLK